MLPHLEGVPAGGSVAVPPPHNFRPIHYPIQNVAFVCDNATFIKADTIARQNGLRYERTVHEYLKDILGERYIIAPILSLRDSNPTPRLLIPDGILAHATHHVAIEIKIRHMPEAWWQLRKLYQPAIEHNSAVPVHVLEIVKSFDPSMPFPEPIHLVENIEEWLDKPKGFGVFVWRP